jgi:alkylresorcinol/alkylpyrone synthase
LVPDTTTLLVAVELCGLSFCPEDHSKSNLVATALFGDGAGAVLVESSRLRRRGPKILAAQSTFWPETYDLLGWDITNEGLKVRFSRDIPSFIRQEIRLAVKRFLDGCGLNLSDVAHFIAHPGGPKILKAFAEALEIEPERLDTCRSILQDYGNMSSATVLFVLERTMYGKKPSPGEYGLLIGLGPGFSAEQLLLKWE